MVPISTRAPVAMASIALAGALLSSGCGSDATADSSGASGATDGGALDGVDGGGAHVADAGATPDGATSSPAADAGPIDWRVNGHVLTAHEQAALMVVAKDVVPRLSGARADRITFAARGAWWALKEGTWGQSLPAIYAYSNCNTTSGDMTIGPLEICGTGRAWQVGLAAVQVPGHTVPELEALLPTLFPGETATQVLTDVASKAGETPATSASISSSLDSLRVSWLLRVPAIGFQALVPGEVVPECIDGAKSWCFGTAWTETSEYAPTKAAAMISITDLSRILSALSP